MWGVRLPLWGSWRAKARLRGQARRERSAHAAISRLFVSAMLSLRPQITVSILALSVTFGDSSPKGGASGVPVRPTRDEQSLIFSGTVVLRCLGQQQLNKVRLSRSRCPRKQGPPFYALSGLRRPVESGPACQWLPLWGQRRRPPPVAETGRSCWGRGQQDASDSEADAGSRNPALASESETERAFLQNPLANFPEMRYNTSRGKSAENRISASLAQSVRAPDC